MNFCRASPSLLHGGPPPGVEQFSRFSGEHEENMMSLRHARRGLQAIQTVLNLNDTPVQFKHKIKVLE